MRIFNKTIGNSHNEVRVLFYWYHSLKVALNTIKQTNKQTNKQTLEVKQRNWNLMYMI